MSVTILGYHISIIRPSLIHVPQKCKDNYARYRIKPKTITNSKVQSVCVSLKSGGTRCLTKGMHIDVLNVFGIEPEEVSKVGWVLEDGREIWR